MDSIEKKRRSENRKEFKGRKLTVYKTEELYNADPNCKHQVVSLWSGVKCIHCKGWFCY
jgi:hypothetical protein